MNKRPNFSLALAALAALFIVNISGAPWQSQTARADKTARLRERLQAKLNEFHAAGKFPGATAGFALADGSSFGLAVGLSDAAGKKNMTPNDLMLQGSVGKTYVAAVTLQLVHEKKIGLDDKIEKYLGKEAWFARLPNGPDITARMLMTHTSGLVRYEFKEQFTADLSRNPDKVWKPEELVAYILDSPPPFTAGKGWQYFDTNYIGVPARLGPETKYGLGVIIRPTPRGVSYGHSGFFPGYVTEMMYFPESKIAISVQVNTSAPRVTSKPLTGFIVDLAELVDSE